MCSVCCIPPQCNDEVKILEITSKTAWQLVCQIGSPLSYMFYHVDLWVKNVRNGDDPNRTHYCILFCSINYIPSFVLYYIFPQILFPFSHYIFFVLDGQIPHLLLRVSAALNQTVRCTDFLHILLFLSNMVENS